MGPCFCLIQKASRGSLCQKCIKWVHSINGEKAHSIFSDHKGAMKSHKSHKSGDSVNARKTSTQVMDETLKALHQETPIS